MFEGMEMEGKGKGKADTSLCNQQKKRVGREGRTEQSPLQETKIIPVKGNRKRKGGESGTNPS